LAILLLPPVCSTLRGSALRNVVAFNGAIIIAVMENAKIIDANINVKKGNPLGLKISVE
jgi:hypothetical protein